MKQLSSLFLCAVVAFVAPGAGAQQASSEISPDALVREVTEDVLSVLRQDKEIQSGDLAKINELVDAKVLPHFNFRRMTQLAVGRDWKKTEAAQQDELVQQFRNLLVRTYTNAITSFRDQKITYKPFRMNPDDTDVLVRTEISQPGGQPVTLDYSMEKTKQGWKVYDVIVGSISLVTSYRETFAQEIRAGGVNGLIHTLTEKNKALLEKKNKS